MSEYENWLKRQQAEDAARKQRVERNAALERERQNQAWATSKRAAEIEAARILGEPSAKLDRILNDALASEFRNARQSSIVLRLDVDPRWVQSAVNHVIARWGDKLELNSSDKDIMSGKSGFLKKKPEEILDHSYYELDFSVSRDKVELYRPQFAYPSSVSMDTFQANPQSVYPVIRAGLEKKSVDKDYWYLDGNKYISGHDYRERARFDAMDA